MTTDSPAPSTETTPAVETTTTTTPNIEPAEILSPPDNIKSAVAQAQTTPYIIDNPVETLRFLSSILQTGRALDLVSIEVESDGLTNYISIDRHNLLQINLSRTAVC